MLIQIYGKKCRIPGFKDKKTLQQIIRPIFRLSRHHHKEMLFPLTTGYVDFVSHTA